MSDRAALIADFLKGSTWQTWDRKALVGDASARRYERLRSGDESVILMDAPPESGEDIRPFVQLVTFLTTHGFAAPQIFKSDIETGLLLISDLGLHDFARWLDQNPADEGRLYQAAADILLKLETCPLPASLTRMTPEVGAAMVAIIGPHYSHGTTDDLCGQMQQALTAFAPDPTVLALRDFHAENLIWRPAETADQAIGLLDFQDAFVAPPGYDLASLLRDARRDVSRNIAEEMIGYFSARTQSKAAFRTAFHCLAVQRNLRILGVFARLVATLGKPRYCAFMPRVWGHILQDLQDPALAALKEAVLDTIPEPTPQKLAELTA